MPGSVIPGDVTQQVSAVCPIDSISFGNVTDKGTWVVHYSTNATPEQIAAAEQVIANFDPIADQAAYDSRVSAFGNDSGRATMLTQLSTYTPAQINNWVDNNLTSLGADARVFIKALLKVLARF